jgi:hypothetical protein
MHPDVMAAMVHMHIVQLDYLFALSASAGKTIARGSSQL